MINPSSIPRDGGIHPWQEGVELTVNDCAPASAEACAVDLSVGYGIGDTDGDGVSERLVYRRESEDADVSIGVLPGIRLIGMSQVVLADDTTWLANIWGVEGSVGRSYPVGDVDGDGLGDFALGNPYGVGGGGAVATVLIGLGGEVTASPELAVPVATLADVAEGFGTSVSGLGGGPGAPASRAAVSTCSHFAGGYEDACAGTSTYIFDGAELASMPLG